MKGLFLAYMAVTFILMCVFAGSVVRYNMRGGKVTAWKFFKESLPAFLWPMLVPNYAEWTLEKVEEALDRADEWSDNGMEWIGDRLVWALDKIFFFLRKS